MAGFVSDVVTVLLGGLGGAATFVLLGAGFCFGGGSGRLCGGGGGGSLSGFQEIRWQTTESDEKADQRKNPRPVNLLGEWGA